jgi:WD40 repeat protein
VVSGVAFSLDGQLVATAGWDKTARIFDTATGKEMVPRFSGRNKVVFSVAFHPSGKGIALSTLNPDRPESGEVWFWDPTTGEESLLPIQEPAEIFRVKFSPDGRFLVTAGATSAATIWEFPTGKRIRSLPGHKANLWDLAFNEDGTRLLTASREGTIKLWEFGMDFATSRELKTWDVASGSSFSRVGYSCDGLIAAAGGNGAITIWNDADYKEVHVLRGPAEAFCSVAFSPDGRFLAAAYKDRTVRLWDVAAWKELHSFRGHSEFVIDLAFSPDGTRLVSSDYEGTAKIWNVKPWTIPLQTRVP